MARRDERCRDGKIKTASSVGIGESHTPIMEETAFVKGTLPSANFIAEVGSKPLRSVHKQRTSRTVSGGPSRATAISESSRKNSLADLTKVVNPFDKDLAPKNLFAFLLLFSEFVI